ncbi:hypothetical protein BDQ12DRAFT_731680 [Crucibulum laeve]|uniref:Uncharacterized protein n=1 Tax=Crucibulum laeve TaxID=68775 RepID=A0A5C3ME30_9AGAR|nr:hypothetical protein BDQ12DRAFT_731680 [Crucibulum laeve]
MDDDITFGASVWGASEDIDVLRISEQSTTLNSTPSESTTQFEDAFDDFEEFGAPAHSTSEDARDDDFGDFGDFGEAEVVESAAFEEDMSFGVAGPSSHREWHPLKLEPLPSRPELEEDVYDILGPIWENEDITNITTDEDIREAEGISQILLTTTSRDFYKTLIQTPPPTKPPNWTRSRIRRQHLIALGIPVNLDEVLPRAAGKPLPPLEIHTRPMSAPPGSRNPPHPGTAAPATTNNSRAGTPQPGGQSVGAQFGPKPELDYTRINKLLELDAETLTIQPLSSLERYLSELKAQTANTSTLLTYVLQNRDALQQDSETYNGLIAEMVGEAQKIKSGKPRTANKRGSTF